MAVQNGIDSKQALSPTSSPTFNALTLTTPLTGANGGTGVNNGSSTVTLGASLTTTPANAITLTTTGATNVTLPTSGTLATTSQIPATPISLANGGTNASLTADNGGIFYSTATAGAILAHTATANQPLLSGASGAPGWSTATYPGSTTVSQLLYSSATNTVGGLATANNGTLVTSNTGVPSVLAGPGTTGNILQSNSSAAPSFSTATYPATTTANQLLVSTATNVVGGLTAGTTGTVLTGVTGAVPSFSATPTVTSISFGGTALSNYTEGTFTPTVVGGSTAGTTTYTAQNGYYTRIGNLVTCYGFVSFSAATGTGQITIGSLPFTIKNQTNGSPVCSVLLSGLAPGAGTAYGGSTGILNTITITCAQVTIATGALGAYPLSNVSGAVYFNITYQI